MKGGVFFTPPGVNEHPQSIPSAFCTSTKVATIPTLAVLYCVPERDENEEAVRNVEKITESEPVDGEDLLGSEDLKRKLREAKN